MNKEIGLSQFSNKRKVPKIPVPLSNRTKGSEQKDSQKGESMGNIMDDEQLSHDDISKRFNTEGVDIDYGGKYGGNYGGYEGSKEQIDEDISQERQIGESEEKGEEDRSLGDERSWQKKSIDSMLTNITPNKNDNLKESEIDE